MDYQGTVTVIFFYAYDNIVIQGKFRIHTVVKAGFEMVVLVTSEAFPEWRVLFPCILPHSGMRLDDGALENLVPVLTTAS